MHAPCLWFADSQTRSKLLRGAVLDVSVAASACGTRAWKRQIRLAMAGLIWCAVFSCHHGCSVCCHLQACSIAALRCQYLHNRPV